MEFGFNSAEPASLFQFGDKNGPVTTVDMASSVHFSSAEFSRGDVSGPLDFLNGKKLAKGTRTEPTTD